MQSGTDPISSCAYIGLVETIKETVNIEVRCNDDGQIIESREREI